MRQGTLERCGSNSVRGDRDSNQNGGSWVEGRDKILNIDLKRRQLRSAD